MSDVNVDIGTSLDDQGTKRLGQQLDAAKEKTEGLTQATEAQNRAADEAATSTQKMGDAHDAAAGSTRDLSAAGGQLTGALNGNISAMAKGIPVSKEFAASLQTAFGVLGAATFGYGVGSSIYKSLVEPFLDAQAALEGVVDAADKASLAISKSLSAEYETRITKIADEAKRIAEAYAEQNKALEEEIGHTKQLAEARAEIEEQKIMAMPAGAGRDRAMAQFRASTSGQRLQGESGAAEQRVEAAERNREALAAQLQKAQEESSNFRAQAMERVPGLREKYMGALQTSRQGEGKMASISRMISPDESQPWAVQKYMENAWPLMAFRGMFGTPNVQGQLGNLEEQMDEERRRATGGSPELQKRVEEIQEQKEQADRDLAEARKAMGRTREVGAFRGEAVSLRESNQLAEIDRREQERIAREKAAAEKRAMEEERRALQEKRKDTEAELGLADRRAHPAQRDALRERAEAQTARTAFVNTRGPMQRDAWEREEREANAAEASAARVIETLAATLARINERNKQLEDRIRNLPIQ